MRLLNVETKRLRTFYGERIPEYAILSHTWGGEEDEVLFQHVAGSDDDRREGEKRKGYKKLSAACKQAKRDGWWYIWIDTCCIDKESSAELSEAINSMYAWYQRSEVCYAYLEDTQIDRNTVRNLVGSRWFTRGWTLQELIAPQRVVFYSLGWRNFGTKVSLRHFISSVTGIRVEMITNYDPNKASVAEKMSWAAKRQTTRVEDMAYCLMGILGVNMPLLYGEGGRAFRRLQEAIMKDSDDHSIFAWRTHHSRDGPNSLELLKETRGLLADSPSDFLGSSNILQSQSDGPYSAYAMTNRGLQITLPIIRVHPNELIGVDSTDSQHIFKAILDCIDGDTSPSRWVVIYLKMIGKDRYVRIFPYWLDDTQMNPNEADRNGWVVSSLFVSQVDTSTINAELNHYSEYLKFKILPTMCGYRYKDKSLVKGESNRISYKTEHAVFIFDRKGKHFGLVIGYGGGTTNWMDIITEDDFEKLNLPAEKDDIIREIRSLYEEGQSRHHVVLQRLNSLCVDVSKDDSVHVSWKLKEDYYKLEYHITLDIQRNLIIDTNDNDNRNHASNKIGPRHVHPDFKKEGVDWFAIFNLKNKRVLDIRPVLSTCDSSEPDQIFFSPDGIHLAMADSSKVDVYNTMTGGITCTLDDLGYEYIRDMCFNSNGNYIAISMTTDQDENGIILVWDITEKRLLHDFTIKSFVPIDLRFTLDSQHIIAVSRSGMTQSFDIISGTLKDVYSWGRDTESYMMVTMSLDGRLIARSLETFIQILDVETKQLVGELQELNQDVGNIMFTSDMQRLVGILESGMTSQSWDISGITTGGVNEGKGRSNHIFPINSLGTSPTPVGDDADRSSRHSSIFSGITEEHTVSHDGRWFASVSKIGIEFWDSRDGTLQFTLQSRAVSNKNWYGRASVPEVGFFGFSPAGNIFATYNYSHKKVQIWKYDEIVQF